MEQSFGKLFSNIQSGFGASPVEDKENTLHINGVDVSTAASNSNIVLNKEIKHTLPSSYNIYEAKWSEPKRKSVTIYDNRIEMIYTQYSTYYYSPSPPSERRTFKIVYSCVDGKWNKSEPIYGKIIPATKEEYEFED
jgi:hypothetical protein